MTPKQIAQKAYDCFASGDMETFATLWADDAAIVCNGMHKFSRTYCGGGRLDGQHASSHAYTLSRATGHSPAHG